MQQLTGGPRAGLTDERVVALLQNSTAVDLEFGLELLAADLSFVEDISVDFVNGVIERNMAAPVHGTLTMTLTRELNWGVDLVRPYVIVTDTVTGLSARFNLGVFCPTTPEDEAGETPRTYRGVQCFDRMYLLDREPGDSVVAAGSVLEEVDRIIGDAGLTGVLLDGSAGGVTLVEPRLWPRLDEGQPTTYLRIINDLLLSINYRGLWADENGLYRSEPWVSPSVRGVEFTFDADDARRTMVTEERKRLQDRFRAWNEWVFVRQNMPGDPPPEPVVGAGLYVVPNTTGLLTRTRTVPLEAADQAALEALGDRVVAADQRVTTKLTVPTAPFPLAGHADVYHYRDAQFGGLMKVQTTGWRLPLANEDMTWEWEVV